MSRLRFVLVAACLACAMFLINPRVYVVRTYKGLRRPNDYATFYRKRGRQWVVEIPSRQLANGSGGRCSEPD